MRYLSGYRADDGTSSSHTAVCWWIRGDGDRLSVLKEDRRPGRMRGIVSNPGFKRKETSTY